MVVDDGGRGIDVRISVSRVIRGWVRPMLALNMERGRAYLRLQRLGHSKFRRSFVKRESNLLLPSFINFLSIRPI